ncbi:class I SAM-dependent methyltransferase [Pseudonocardia humida]|uniref:Methyltransferase domain-containing protein n=1 Tax=Pseudonocardia humida TaxID=2800819 RepID=A0ABT1A743_9PSEU|nr:methyltransferase domain-containing protein [Pseudonocardia humida]MCO1658728.1 methyltransferase domain-containing protein [Pseudonocardia humida]
MARADRERWDRRYADAGPVEPAPPLALRGHEDLLPPAGRALDVACGRGQVAVWLALRGLTVDAVDVSPVGLGAVAELAERHGVADRVHRHHHDLDAGLPVPGAYQVVVCQRFRDPALYPRLTGALAPGGLLAVTVLSRVGGDGPFRAEPGELATAFAGLEVLDHREGDGEAVLLARAR